MSAVKTIGIIGGGQLGLMIIEQAHLLGAAWADLMAGDLAGAQPRVYRLLDIVASLPTEPASVAACPVLGCSSRFDRLPAMSTMTTARATEITYATRIELRSAIGPMSAAPSKNPT